MKIQIYSLDYLHFANLSKPENKDKSLTSFVFESLIIISFRFIRLLSLAALAASTDGIRVEMRKKSKEGRDEEQNTDGKWFTLE
jgi:hypothetical protein